MRLLISAVSAVLMMACNEPDEATGRSDTLYWFVPNGVRPPSEELLGGVEEIFGVEMLRSDEGAGAVTIFLADLQGGWSYSAGWSCTPFAYVETHTPHVLAHEIGHAFTLEHSDDPSNLMFPGGAEDHLTEQQIDTVREKLWETEEYCR